MHDHPVGSIQVAHQRGSVHHRIQQHQISISGTHQVVDGAHQRRPRNQHRGADTSHGEGLRLVPCVGAGMVGGHHGERVRRQPAPEFPQIGLDPTELGREIVGHQDVMHRLPARVDSWNGGTLSDLRR